MKVCVDPGHGMGNASPGLFDPGTTHREAGTEYREADIALRYGLTLKDVLRARQIEVFMTRDDNRDVAPVGQRATAARNAGCDCFVSLHINSVEDENANGTETLYRDQADVPFAQRLQNATVGALGLRDRGLKQRTDLAVLRFQGPAALVELGFIRNDTDRNRFLEPQRRTAVCEAIANALGDHFNLAPAGAMMAELAGTRADPQVALAVSEMDESELTDEAAYDVADPLILGRVGLTTEAFATVFGPVGLRENFNMAEFEELVARWNLKHFSPAEFLFLGGQHYGGGSCGGLNALPPQRLWRRLENTARMIDAIRERFGHPIRIISAYRNEEYNRCVRGGRGSLHLEFNALDFTNEGGSLREMFAAALHARESDPRFLGGIGYYPGDRFVHIDTRGRQADWRG